MKKTVIDLGKNKNLVYIKNCIYVFRTDAQPLSG